MILSSPPFDTVSQWGRLETCVDKMFITGCRCKGLVTFNNVQGSKDFGIRDHISSTQAQRTTTITSQKCWLFFLVFSFTNFRCPVPFACWQTAEKPCVAMEKAFEATQREHFTLELSPETGVTQSNFSSMPSKRQGTLMYLAPVLYYLSTYTTNIMFDCCVAV